MYKKEHTVILLYIIMNRMCINCKKRGHFYKECRFPLNSYGIILFRVTDQSKIEYLFVCRKHTFGYVEILRGGYDKDDYIKIRQLLSELTYTERENLLNQPFQWLWEDLWMITMSSENEKSNKEFRIAEQKYNYLVASPMYQSLLEEIPCLWECPEWGFPKGRKNWAEDEKNCAMRECFEETNIHENQYQVMEEFYPIVENFKGTDDKLYRNTYFVCCCHDNKLLVGVDQTNLNQQREISEIVWFDLESAKQNIRPYNIEKVQILTKLDRKIRSELHKYLPVPPVLTHPSSIVT